MWVWVHGRVLTRVLPYLSLTQRSAIFVICDLSGFTVFFFTYVWHDFRKKVTEHEMCVLIFCIIFTRNISYSKRNAARFCHKCENVLM